MAKGGHGRGTMEEADAEQSGREGEGREEKVKKGNVCFVGPTKVS